MVCHTYIYIYAVYYIYCDLSTCHPCPSGLHATCACSIGISCLVGSGSKTQGVAIVPIKRSHISARGGLVDQGSLRIPTYLTRRSLEDILGGQVAYSNRFPSNSLE